MSTAEEFVLMPKNQLIKEQPYSSESLNDPRVQHTGAQFFFLNSMPPNENTNKECPEDLESRETVYPNELSKQREAKILQNLNLLAPATGMNFPFLLFDLRQPTKNLNNSDYFMVIEALNLTEDLMINSIAKIAIWKGNHRVFKQKKKKKKTISPKGINH